MSDVRDERLQIMVSPEELAAIDDFRFKHRIPTRAASVRELLKLGLASAGTVSGSGLRSSQYGVLGTRLKAHSEDNGSGG
jgi:hypothetical protein